MAVNWLAACAHPPLSDPPRLPVATQVPHGWESPALRANFEWLGGGQAPPGDRIDATAAVAAALTFNAQMEVSRAQVETGHAGVLVARQRANPTLSLTPERALGALAAGSPWVAAIALVWPVQTAGKRALAIEQALAMEDASLLGAVGSVWTMRLQARAALCNAEYRQHLATLATREASLREELASRLDKQADAGVASRYEAARAHLDGEGAALRAQQAEAEQDGARHELAAVMGLPVAAVGVPLWGEACLDGHLPADDARVDVIVSESIASRLDLRGRLAEFRAADGAWRAEVAKRAPDLNMGPGYTYDQGVRKLTFSLSFELPLHGRNTAGIAHAAAERRRVAAEIVALQDEVLAGVQRARVLWQAAEQQVGAATQMARRADQLLQRDVARQRDGEIDNSAVVLSRIALVAAQAEVLAARKGLADAVASFEAAAEAPVAAPFFDTTMAREAVTASASRISEDGA